MRPTLKVILYSLARLTSWFLIIFCALFITDPELIMLRLIGLIAGVEGLILLTAYSSKQSTKGQSQ